MIEKVERSDLLEQHVDLFASLVLVIVQPFRDLITLTERRDNLTCFPNHGKIYIYILRDSDLNFFVV